MRSPGSRSQHLRLRVHDVVVHIPSFIIYAKIEFLQQSRFSDFLNGEQSDFVLLRDASVHYADTGQLAQSLEAIQVNKESITLAYLLP